MNKEHHDANKFNYVSEKARSRIFIDNLLGGIAWGFGSIIGATIIIGVFGLAITRSQHIPLIGDIVQVFLEEIQQGRNTNIFIQGETSNQDTTTEN